MSREELIEELGKKLDEARKADGFFVTVTALKGNRLQHYQCQSDFKKEDLETSLLEIAKMVEVSLVKPSDLLAGISNRRTWN